MNDLFTHGTPELAEDADRLLVEIDRETPGAAAATANCRPPLDIVQRAESVDIIVDVPGVAPESLRVAIRRNTLLVVGSKPAGPLETTARFHLAERSYGRFARAVRIDGAFDAARARAVVGGGELRITLPLFADRRGQVLAIPVERV